MNSNLRYNNSGFRNNSSNIFPRNDYNTSNARNNFFDYFTESIANKIINYFQIPEFNLQQNNLPNNNRYQRQNNFISNYPMEPDNINTGNYQIKKNKKIIGKINEYNNNIKKDNQDNLIQKMMKRRKENIAKFLNDYRLKNSKKTINPLNFDGG